MSKKTSVLIHKYLHKEKKGFVQMTARYVKVEVFCTMKGVDK